MYIQVELANYDIRRVQYQWALQYQSLGTQNRTRLRVLCIS